MAVIEPDTIQKGAGVIGRFKKFKRNVKTTTGKVVSDKNIIAKKKKNITKDKPLDTLQTSTIKRLGEISSKTRKKREGIASQKKVEAQAKQAAARAAVQARPKQTARKNVTRNVNVKKQLSQQITTTIKAKARAAAERATADIKAQLTRRSSDLRDSAAFSLKTRLEKLKGNNTLSTAVSIRAGTGDTLKTLGSAHGTAANLLKSSGETIGSCNTKIEKADSDNKKQLSNKSKTEENIRDARLSDREKDRENVAQDIKKKSTAGEQAGTNAGTALEKEKSMPDKIKDKTKDRDGLIKLTPAEIENNRKAGESSGGVAADQNTKRSNTFSAAGGQINTRGKHDSARQSAAGDVVTHSGQLSSATIRKDQNDKALEGVKKTHQADVDRMNTNAGGAVTTNKKNLDDADTAATGPRKTEQTNASTARSKKEGEVEPNASAISKKGGEVNTARGHESNAKNDYDRKAESVTSINGTLSSQMSTLPSVKKNRDDALTDAENKRPARPASDETNANRRGAISSTDIPDQQRIKTGAEQGLRDANAQLTKTTPLKDANLREIAPMGGVRSTRLETDANLNRRKGEAEKANGGATKSRIPVAEDIKQRQAVGKRYRENSDAVNNIIQARSLVTKQGVTVVPTKNIVEGISTKQRESSIAGAAAAKNHAIASGGLNTSNKNLSDVNGKIKTAAGDQVKKQAIRDDMLIGISREKTNAGKIDDARRDLPSKITKGKTEENVAARRIKEDRDGIAISRYEIDMEKDAYNYFNDPLEPTRKLIDTNKKLSTAAGNDALRSRDIFTRAGMESKHRNAQVQADAGRQQSAKDIVTYTRARDDAVVRKGANDTAMTGVQKKHQADMDAMNSNPTNAVTNNKKKLDDANTAGGDQNTKAANATKLRSAKDGEAQTQGAATASKLKELNTARTNEALAKKADDNAKADITEKQATLSSFLGNEPSLKAARENTLSTAEASRPLRDSNYTIIAARKAVIDGTELPKAKKIYDDKPTNNENLIDLLEGPGGLRDQRYLFDVELEDIKTRRGDMANKNARLRILTNAENTRLIGLRSTREGIDASIANGNKRLIGRSQHVDNINNVITAKKKTGVSEPPAKVKNDIAAKQTTSGNTMTSSARQYVSSKGRLDNSAEHIKGVKANIDDNTNKNGKLSTEKKGLQDNISRENMNRGDRLTDMAGGAQQIKKLQKKADDASDSMNDAVNNKADLNARPGGMDDLKYYKGIEEAKLRTNAENAEAAGKTAADANSGRNISASNAKTIRGTIAGHDANRKSEFGNTPKYQKELEAARQRKIGSDTNLDNVKSTHKASMDKMNSDVNGTVVKYKKEVDDGQTAASGQYTKAEDTGGKRKGAEEDVDKNKKNIDNKTKEVDKARENELAAKQKNDADRAAVGSKQADLDAANLQKPPLKKNRDDTEAAVNDARPTRSPADSAKKQRQSEINGEIGAIQKQKGDASDAKAAAADRAKRAKAEKDALSKPDDTTDLRKKNDDLEKKQKNEQTNRENLESESAKNKKKKEQSEFQITKNQLIVGVVSGMIMDMIHGKTTFFDPPVIPPYITGAFVYPIPTASGSVLTSASGPTPPLVLDLSGNPKIVPTEIDASGLGNIGPMGPISSGASGASDYINGKVAGTQDGTRDGTTDATNVFLNGNSSAIKDLENKIGMLEYAKQKDIDKEIIARSQNAYCKKLEDEGVKQKLDIYKVFSECSAYFKKNPPMASQPVLEKLTLSTAESGASESGAQEGGYIEDISGVMQFGGVLTNSGPEPVDAKDIAYMNGYRSAYKAAYTQAYSLTFAIKLTQKASEKKKEPATDYGEALKEVINASMPKGPITEGSAKGPGVSGAVDGSEVPKGGPSGSVKSKIITEASANKPSVSGAVEDSGAVEGPSGSVKSNIITEASANKSTTSGASGPSQVGGFIKLAKRSYQRGKTLTQHAHLLNKIKGKTNVA
jgi:hypothetical protein